MLNKTKQVQAKMDCAIVIPPYKYIAIGIIIKTEKFY